MGEQPTVDYDLKQVSCNYDVDDFIHIMDTATVKGGV
jgi:hypothetical protein